MDQQIGIQIVGERKGSDRERYGASALERRPPPTLTRGEEVSLTLFFELGDGYHADDVEHADDTLHGGDVTAIREWLDYADVVRFGRTDRGVPWFRERLPGIAPVDSQLVLVDPERDMIDIPAFWALIIDGDEQGEPINAETPAQVTLDLVVLGTLDEYPDRETVRADLGDKLNVE